MKVLLLFLGDIDEAPYYKNYIKTHVTYHSISVNKYNNSDNYTDIDQKYYLSNDSRIKKIIEYKKKLKELVLHNDYNFIIILNSQLSVLLNYELMKYQGGIILDIRDYVLEKNYIYSYFQNRVIKKSILTILSSPGYKSFLPKSKYFICHNIPVDLPKSTFINNNKPNFNELRIGQIGFIRFFEFNNKIIDFFNSNNKIKLYYIGNGSERLKYHANVVKHGYFKPENTYNWYKEINLINNLYGNKDMNVKFALSNKLYLSAIMYIPILVSPNTEMARVVSKYNIGYVIDINNNYKKIEKMIEYFQTLDWDVFKRNCDRFINDMERDNKVFHDELNHIFKGD